jgi:cytochrome c biogenesis protein CcmG, thiol:disulfide interchange protein DsbE
VVLNFWAADCPPCRAEMPWLNDAAEQFEGEVIVFGLDVGVFTGLGSNERGRLLLEELGVDYPAGAAVDATSLELYRIRSMPSTVFFSADGTQVRTHAGIMTAGQIEAAIAELVEAS